MRRRTEAGFTMIELMVAVAILSVVVAGVMESFVVQNRAYTVVDQSTETQQNTRAVATLVDRDLQMTGFMVPEGAAACAIDETTKSDTLYVTDADAIDPDGQTQANLGASVSGALTITGPTTGTAVTLGDLALDGKPFYDTDNDGAADSDFRENAGVIVMDPTNPGRGTACGIVRDVRVGTKTLVVDFESGLGAGGTTGFIAIPAHRYAVVADANGVDDDGNGVDDESNMTRDGVSLVSNVEDLQVALFVDANDNGAVDANEYAGAEDAPAPYHSNGTDHSALREIRFDLVLRSRLDDPNFHDGAFQPSENREAVAGTDGFRRRELHTTVKPRNLGFRG